jgi:Ni,Fe-hydrogenase I cytochrome b subunit
MQMKEHIVRGFVLTVVIVDELFWNFNANKAMRTLFVEKTSSSPPCRFAWKFIDGLPKLWRNALLL